MARGRSRRADSEGPRHFLDPAAHLDQADLYWPRRLRHRDSGHRRFGWMISREKIQRVGAKRNPSPVHARRSDTVPDDQFPIIITPGRTKGASPESITRSIDLSPREAASPES